MPGRAVATAQTWVNACAPAPMQRRVRASSRASNSVALPETAPVRSAVRKVPSRIAQRLAGLRVEQRDERQDRRQTARPVGREDRDDFHAQPAQRRDRGGHVERDPAQLLIVERRAQWRLRPPRREFGEGDAHQADRLAPSAPMPAHRRRRESARVYLPIVLDARIAPGLKSRLKAVVPLKSASRGLRVCARAAFARSPFRRFPSIIPLPSPRAPRRAMIGTAKICGQGGGSRVAVDSSSRNSPVASSR